MDHLKKKTIESLVKHSDDIYSLTYYADYDLDYVLSKEPTSIFKIIKVTRRVINEKRTYKTKVLPLGCSTFSFKNNEGNPCFARNFDYRTSPCLVVKTAPKNGYKSIGICDLNFMLYGYKNKVEKNPNRIMYSPYMVMDGMNEKGLAVSVLELNDKPTKQKNKKSKINTSLMIRYVLDKCANVDEAIEAFKKHDMYSSLGFNYHFHIVDKDKSIVIEYVNNELRIIPSNLLTNFYLSKDGNNKKTYGQDRYGIIKKELSDSGGILSYEQAFETLDKVNQHYWFVYKFFVRYYVDTCYSAIYDLTNLSVQVRRNNKIFSFEIK